MACGNPKEMRFRVYKYDLPSYVGKGGTIHDSNASSTYHGPGVDFTITEEEAKAANVAIFRGYGPPNIFNENNIAYVMMEKLYKFN